MILEILEASKHFIVIKFWSVFSFSQHNKNAPLPTKGWPNWKLWWLWSVDDSRMLTDNWIHLLCEYSIVMNISFSPSFLSIMNAALHNSECICLASFYGSGVNYTLYSHLRPFDQVGIILWIQVKKAKEKKPRKKAMEKKATEKKSRKRK